MRSCLWWQCHSSFYQPSCSVGWGTNQRTYGGQRRPTFCWHSCSIFLWFFVADSRHFVWSWSSHCFLPSYVGNYQICLHLMPFGEICDSSQSFPWLEHNLAQQHMLVWCFESNPYPLQPFEPWNNPFGHCCSCGTIRREFPSIWIWTRSLFGHTPKTRSI